MPILPGSPNPLETEDEAKALARFVGARPEKQFFLIDHHPLPLHRLQATQNLHMSYRPDVCECAIGPRSGLMVVAAHPTSDTAAAKATEPLSSATLILEPLLERACA